MTTQLAQSPGRPARPPMASVASWLSVLFVLVLAGVVAGGYVRLSGSGLSIPEWPIVNGSLLPPLSDQGWAEVKAQYQADQERLRLEVMRGAPGIGSLGRVPEDLPSFKRMFLIEWTHRLAAALVGLVAIGCLTVALRHAETRRRAARPLGLVVGLIVVQALLGGILVRSGTATHWLFLHLGMAAIILALLVWTILRLISADQPPAAIPAALRERRRPLRRTVHIALAITWLQVTLGALVAGSRGSDNNALGNNDFSSEWPTMMGGRWIPQLWVGYRPLAWNLLDNAFLHQWLHRWFALAVLLTILAVFVVAGRAELGPRGRLALRAIGAFIFAQIVLGLANVVLVHPLVVSLSHLVMGMFLLSALVLLAFDAGREPSGQLLAAGSAVPA